jgi:hypothetical protein
MNVYQFILINEWIVASMQHLCAESMWCPIGHTLERLPNMISRTSAKWSCCPSARGRPQSTPAASSSRIAASALLLKHLWSIYNTYERSDLPDSASMRSCDLVGPSSPGTVDFLITYSTRSHPFTIHYEIYTVPEIPTDGGH